MGVAHGTDKNRVLEHKRAIDQHLESVGIPVSYTNVFWGGRSEIKPSEISPFAYREWLGELGETPATKLFDGTQCFYINVSRYLQIGKASCRGRGENSGVDVSFKKKTL